MKNYNKKNYVKRAAKVPFNIKIPSSIANKWQANAHAVFVANETFIYVFDPLIAVPAFKFSHLNTFLSENDTTNTVHLCILAV